MKRVIQLAGVVLFFGHAISYGADLQQGKALVTRGAPGVQACAACHGATGAGSRRDGYPRLAGLDAAYLVHELEAFKASTRQNGIMQPIAKQLTTVQMQDVAAWFASQKLPSPVKTHASNGALRRGQELAEHGDWSRDVPACESCHGNKAQGVGPHFPRLAGQYAAYLETQLHNWRRGFRKDDPMGLMKGIASRLTHREISAVSAYLETLPSATALPLPTAPLADRGVLRDTKLFGPPPWSAMPTGPFGDAVREGARIFDDTPRYAPAYAGNDLSCVNCHLDSGRRAGSAPMWAAYVAFPAYRSKNHQVNTLAQRVQGCFRFSENGHPPPQESPTMTALLSYFAWMSRGAPTGAQMAGRGYPKLPAAAEKPSAVRGAMVYREHCALCHGATGQGTRASGRTVFPPLWGPRSFNGGAGMHKVKNAAAFIKANMPYGAGGSLSNQQAWDVAAYVDSQPRPPDPRKVAGKR